MLPRIVAVGTAVPQWRYSQQQLLEMAGRNRVRDAFFLNSDIDYRHLYFEPGFTGQETIDEMLARARNGAVELGEEAIRSCLARAGTAPSTVDFLSTATCTVSMCPQLDALFIRDLGMSPFTQRTHVGDTGCAAAMVALQAAWNHLRAFPGHRAAAVSVEICSAAMYRDGTAEAALGEAIFGDGSGAVLLSCEGPGFEILAHKTLIRSEHIGLTGFDFPGGARRLVLAKEVPVVGAAVLTDLAGAIFREHGLKQSDIRFWIVHSAGRKVLDKAKESLGLDEEDLHYCREVFRRFGNMSSATVLFVLDEVMTAGRPRAGDLALMVAMGAGFAAEGALLRWAQ